MTLKEGKEYYFACGRHAAIVRKNEGVIEYLELQSSKENGWKPFGKDTLKTRFGAKRSHTFYGRKYNVESVLLEFLWCKNTNYLKQHLRNKLDFELTSPSASYSNKDIIRKAITEKIRLIDRQIEWNEMVSKAASLKSFKTRSSIYKGCLAKIDEAIQQDDFSALENGIAEAEKQQQKLISKQLKKGSDAKSALNSEYKGASNGKDIAATIDTSNMVSEDPYRGTYTNNIARLQGFDSPAKLVSESEFQILEKACGEVFYRTVNPTKFKGKNMTSAEFASQLYKADLLELNGPGGRVYGDGMYVATSAWDGRRQIQLSDSAKSSAYRSSINYGRGSHTISEMTWTRKPRIIKESDLDALWSKLTREQRFKFGGSQARNTYACALGYDAMYCDGADYMVIWNRSIIAVKSR